MKIVVPLAGPDFVLANGTVKATLQIDGQPLLRRALGSRPWAGRAASGDHVFVLADDEPSRSFAAGTLSEWYPAAPTVFVSPYARGAALSALAGVARIADAVSEPVVIDLADILYASDDDPLDLFDTRSDDRPGTGAIVPTFASDNTAYSYLRTDGTGEFVEAAEKRVIASQASAGTYLFRNAATYLRAVAHALDDQSGQTHAGLFYVCPLMNGVRASGMRVLLHPVDDVVDIKIAGAR